MTLTEDELMNSIAADRIPRHIAIIMDGNGRWAVEQGLPRVEGHRRGVESVRDVVTACKDLGVEVLTLYVFSTENWERPRREVNALMVLLERSLRRDSRELKQNNVRLRVIGRIQDLPKPVIEAILESMEMTAGNTGLILNLAINYGGRSEILDAARSFCDEVISGRVRPEQVDEGLFERYLYTKGLPDPDLVIRTGGDMRVSNFLLWQSAYSEFWVTGTQWPAFRRKNLLQAILDYQARQRRFGR